MTIIRTALCAAAIAACAGTAAIAAAPAPVVVHMKALNNSGETGTATLTQESAGVRVVVNLSNAKGEQPTHIHIGTCGNINKAPEYPLVNTVNGKGNTVVKGVTLDQLLKGKYAINVHKSLNDIGTYVSCGNIAK